ncbi:uncharacterized protein VP01_1242g2 [Puccinia sorghi]|uniref:Uncharacterized protein n=1 Tax=Puccinia sorghi TaxID=27349 RepID=A0A0L6VPL3_9BASI|nr:uncharacterized protein VP01_1242g2 [Puccinia sorghi]
MPALNSQLLKYLLVLVILPFNSIKLIPYSKFTPSFSICSGTTHNILSDSYTCHLGFFPYAESTRHTFSGFDVSTHSSSFELSVTLHNEANPHQNQSIST